MQVLLISFNSMRILTVSVMGIVICIANVISPGVVSPTWVDTKGAP